MKASDRGTSGTVKVMREKVQKATEEEKVSEMLTAHKVFILHRTVMWNDPKCLEAFEKNCIVIPVVEFQEVGKKARGAEIDFGAWKFIENLAIYEKHNNSKRMFKTQSGASVIFDSNGNNFDDLSHGMEKSQANRIYLVAWNIISQLCEAKKEQKGSKLTEKEVGEIIKKVIIVSSDPVVTALGQQEGLETQEYRSGNFISNISDLYTGIIELNIDSSVENMVDLAVEDDSAGVKRKIVKGEKLAEYVDLGKLYPNQCCILKFEDRTLYAIYKKSKNIFRVVDQRPDQKSEKETAKIGPKNMEQCFFEALARDKSIALITVIGGAGTGKTIMVAKAALEILEKESDMNVVVYRPIVDNGRELGFFPGDYDEKIAKYLQPVVDAFRFVASNGKSRDADPPKGTSEHEMLNAAKNGTDSPLNGYRRTGRLRLESINFIQGRTNHDTVMFNDEAQDFIQTEMEALLKRIGNNGRIWMTGDLRQIHRPFLQPIASGLVWAIENGKNSERTAHITFSKVYRHPLVEEISMWGK